MKTYVHDLMQLDLSELEAKVYCVLLRKKSFTAKEVSSVTNIFRTQTYDVLNSLINKGMCIENLGGVKKYSAVDPLIVFGNIRKSLQDKLEITDRLSEKLHTLFIDNANNVNPLEFIEVLRSNQMILQKIKALVADSKSAVMSFSKPPYVMNPEQLGNPQRPPYYSIDSAIKNYAIYEVESENMSDFIKMITFFKKTGEKIRIAKELPMKMMIFDGAKVLYTLSNQIKNKDVFTSILVEHPELTKTLTNTFWMEWEKAIPFDDFICEHSQDMKQQ